MQVLDPIPALDIIYNDVDDFHRVFEHARPKVPQMLGPELVRHRAGFMREEIQEFEDAKTLVDQADAMIDLIYFAVGTLVCMCVRPGILWHIVHHANMSKIWPDGKVHKRAGDNKTLKPPGWVAPEPLLKHEIERQIDEA